MQLPFLFSYASRTNKFWLCCGLGVISALGFPPFYLPIFFAVTFVAFLATLLAETDVRRSFVLGWAFAFGQMVAGLYWIAASMFVDIKQFWWAVPLAVFGLPALLAIYNGLVVMIARKLIPGRGIVSALALALGWFLADYARGHFLTGFPWNLSGMIWSGFLPMLQSISIVGIEGLGLLTLLCFAATVPFFQKRNRQTAPLACSALLVLVLTAGWGQWRILANKDISYQTQPHSLMRIVHPQVEQALKWKAEEAEKQFQHLIALSTVPPQLSGGKPIPPTIIWPETATTYFLEEERGKRLALAAQLPENTLLLTGVIRRQWQMDRGYRYTNSLIALNKQADIIATYDKVHLVPFGEYVPLRRFIPLRTLAALGIDMAHGEALQTISIGSLPKFSPLICYEAIFSGEVTARNAPRPDFLLNITNDGWFGYTSGPYQHFENVRLRAIEEGLPLIRSANAGITAVIDPLGQIWSRQDLGHEGYLDTEIPASLPPTFFSRYGTVLTDSLALLALLLLFIGAIAKKWLQKRAIGK